jgi:hypothetical protein
VPLQRAKVNPKPKQTFGMVIIADDTKLLQAIAEYAKGYFGTYDCGETPFFKIENGQLILNDAVIDDYCNSFKSGGSHMLKCFKQYLKQKNVKVETPPVLSNQKLSWQA